MQDRQLVIRVGTLLFGLVTALGAWLFTIAGIYTPAESGLLTVTFLDVGQGDAILIETPDEVQVLIDGGPDRSVLRQLSAELPWFDTTLDMVLGTHPDKDHIGGLVDVLSRYTVGHIVTTENIGETMVASVYQQALLEEGVPVTYARSGQIFTLGASTTLEIFSPASNPKMLESNTSSIVAKLTYGSSTFMLTGDAPIGIEEYMVRTYGDRLQSDVFKLGHHGSKTSTSEQFLNIVQANFAVVSAGANNSYGHPHAAVVASVTDRGIPLLSTAESGNITFYSNGTSVWLEQ